MIVLKMKTLMTWGFPFLCDALYLNSVFHLLSVGATRCCRGKASLVELVKTDYKKAGKGYDSGF